ncbi:hypothetical protein J116_004075 [Streptomyces thermolilacinus SPC6]|uniref:Uncharacterized protein n=1 Tax=Streptomyces thermolilacinus SPC6 TaxID=1306406 RepID=A0A1D3DN80_9ACTN|nr:hypothetical protein J116_004075 [Streptomyces thermolilacinus SPC6]
MPIAARVGGPDTRGAGSGPSPPVPRHDPEPIEARFPQLGPLAGSPGRHGRRRAQGRQLVPGPTDVRLSGVARLTPDSARRLVAAHPWSPAATPPAPLDAVAPEVPPGTARRTSDAFVRAVTWGRYEADFHFDPEQRIMVFDALNPTRARSVPPKGA